MKHPYFEIPSGSLEDQKGGRSTAKTHGQLVWQCDIQWPSYALNYFIVSSRYRFTDEEVDEMYREAPIKNGMFDYQEFTRILKHGAKEKDEA